MGIKCSLPYKYLDGFEIMRKDAFTFTLTTFVLGIFGFFLRWLQNVNGFEALTGLAIAGAKTTTVFLVYSVAALAGMVAMVLLWVRRRCTLSEEGAEALGCSTVFHTAIMWLFAAVIIISCLVLMFASDFARYPTMQRIMSALGILAGVALPFVLPRKKPEEGEGGGISGTAAIIPILFGCMWLVTAYRVHSENPVLWQYVIEVLAIAAATMGFYYTAAYFYGKAKPGRCLVTVQIAAYFCLCTMTDEHETAEAVLFAVTAAIMLLLQFVIVENAKKKEE